MSFFSSLFHFHRSVTSYSLQWEFCLKETLMFISFLFSVFTWKKRSHTPFFPYSLFKRDFIITYVMLERSLVFVISKYLGTYVNAVSEEDIQLSLWNGELVLQHIVRKSSRLWVLDTEERVSWFTQSPTLRWWHIDWFPEIRRVLLVFPVRFRSLGLISATNPFSYCLTISRFSYQIAITRSSWNPRAFPHQTRAVRTPWQKFHRVGKAQSLRRWSTRIRSFNLSLFL